MHYSRIGKIVSITLQLLTLSSCSKGLPIDSADPAQSTATSTMAATSNRFGPKGEVLTPEEEERRAALGECVSMQHCPKFEPDVLSFGFTKLGMRGFVGEPVPWLMNGIDDKSDKRRVGVLVNNLPSGAVLIPADRVATEANIDWVPNEKMRSVVKLEIYMRDLDRCVVEQARPDVCYNYSVLENYDIKAAIDWEIITKEDLERVTEAEKNAKDRRNGGKPDLEWPPVNEKCKAKKSEKEGRLSEVIQGSVASMSGGKLLSESGKESGC